MLTLHLIFNVFFFRRTFVEGDSGSVVFVRENNAMNNIQIVGTLKGRRLEEENVYLVTSLQAALDTLNQNNNAGLTDLAIHEELTAACLK